jgi:ubiquinone/menaquinone biosynthesis C-methylase UbiE
MSAQDHGTRIKQTFDTVADGYDKPALRFFVNSADHLAAALGLNGNERLLDVATGTGANALALARRLPSGHVTGIDFSAGMLQQARAKAERAALRNVDFVEMDMQRLEFPDNSFDVTTCAFGIFFVEDMETQLKHIASKVAPGGKVAATGFYDTAFQPLAELLFRRLDLYGVERPAFSWKRISTEEKFAALFEKSGLGDVSVQRKNAGYHLRDAEEWWELVWNAGFRGAVSQIPAQRLEEFKREHLAEIQREAASEGIWLNIEVLYATGIKAEHPAK